jgi:hypothetical protein
MRSFKLFALFVSGICLSGAFAGTNYNVTINSLGATKDGLMGFQVSSQSGMDACNKYMFYVTDKTLQANILAGYSTGKKIHKMIWTNTTTQVDLGGDLTTCRIDYADFEP